MAKSFQFSKNSMDKGTIPSLKFDCFSSTFPFSIKDFVVGGWIVSVY